MKPTSDDARQDLTIAAAARERRNRPIGLLAASGVLLLVMVLAALLAVGSRASAAGSLREAARLSQDIESRIAELEQLRSEAEHPQGGSGAVGEPMREIDVQAKLEQVAQEVGLKEKAQNAKPTSSTKGKLRIVEFRYQNLRSENLHGMLEWVRRSAEAVPGLEVYGLDLRWDGAGVCTMNVTFRRWERAE